MSLLDSRNTKQAIVLADNQLKTDGQRYAGIAFKIIDYSLIPEGQVIKIGTSGAETSLTEGVEWTASTSNVVTAASLNTALDAVSGYDAVISEKDTTETIAFFATAGEAGNEKVGQMTGTPAGMSMIYINNLGQITSETSTVARNLSGGNSLVRDGENVHVAEKNTDAKYDKDNTQWLFKMDVQPTSEIFTVDETILSNKKFVLSNIPYSTTAITLQPYNATRQFAEADFTVGGTDNKDLDFTGKDLESILTLGSKVWCDYQRQV